MVSNNAILGYDDGISASTNLTNEKHSLSKDGIWEFLTADWEKR